MIGLAVRCSDDGIQSWPQAFAVVGVVACICLLFAIFIWKGMP